MKVLLVNPGYPQTFWSFNQVLKMLGKKVVDPPLGLITVGALLPDDWELRLVELTVRPVHEDEWDFCDIVFVTGMVNQTSGIVDTVREAKRRGKYVVVGGPMVFHFPEKVFQAGADLVVKGEAEVCVQALLDAINRRDSGRLIKSDSFADLATSPLPRFDLLNFNDYAAMAVQFSRGCPFHCEFCDITYMLGRKVRTKSPDQILRELQALYDLGWRREIFFVDDNFIGSQRATKALLKELIPWMEQRGHPFDFHTQASVNMAESPELMEMMVKAGFYKVFIGIESTDEESLKQTKKHQNTGVDLDEVCGKITRAGLQIQAGCIIGFDNEEPGVDERLIEFANRTKIPEMFVTLLQAGPGTDLWKRLEIEGRLLPSNFDDQFGSQTSLINFETTRPLKDIVAEFIRTYKELYTPEAYLDRVFQHYLRMDPYPVKKAFQKPYWSEVRVVATVLYRQGIVSPSRLQFWKCLFGAMTKFPKHLTHFFTACVVAEHYYEYRETIEELLGAAMMNAPAPVAEEKPVQAVAK
jgi:radical SAM superfamily enzyme YgiQ (UPF0313 family)